jgi:hypothetical protein
MSRSVLSIPRVRDIARRATHDTNVRLVAVFGVPGSRPPPGCPSIDSLPASRFGNDTLLSGAFDRRRCCSLDVAVRARASRVDGDIEPGSPNTHPRWILSLPNERLQPLEHAWSRQWCALLCSEQRDAHRFQTPSSWKSQRVCFGDLPRQFRTYASLSGGRRF